MRYSCQTTFLLTAKEAKSKVLSEISLSLQAPLSSLYRCCVRRPLLKAIIFTRAGYLETARFVKLNVDSPFKQLLDLCAHFTQLRPSQII